MYNSYDQDNDVNDHDWMLDLRCPYISITVKSHVSTAPAVPEELVFLQSHDSEFKIVEPTQHLVVCGMRGPNILVWGQVYHMQTPLQLMASKNTYLEIVLYDYDPSDNSSEAAGTRLNVNNLDVQRYSRKVATGKYILDYNTLNTGNITISLDSVSVDEETVNNATVDMKPVVSNLEANGNDIPDDRQEAFFTSIASTDVIAISAEVLLSRRNIGSGLYSSFSQYVICTNNFGTPYSKSLLNTRFKSTEAVTSPYQSFRKNSVKLNTSNATQSLRLNVKNAKYDGIVADSINVMGSRYDFKRLLSKDRIRDIPCIKFLSTLPRDVVPGQTIRNINGKFGIHVLIPDSFEDTQSFDDYLIGKERTHTVIIESSIGRLLMNQYFYDDILVLLNIEASAIKSRKVAMLASQHERSQRNRNRGDYEQTDLDDRYIDASDDDDDSDQNGSIRRVNFTFSGDHNESPSFDYDQY